MRLIDGAEAIRGDLPASATTVVEVPLGAGEALDSGVMRYSTLAVVRDRVAMALAALPAENTPLIVGGDCSVEVAGVAHALERRPGLAVVWFDAHPDLNDAASSPSGAFTGMVARALLGTAPDGLAVESPLAPGRLVLAGTRVFDDGEPEFVAAQGIPLLPPEALRDPGALVAAVEASGADAVYLHVDLDVLDPEEIQGIDPQPFGVSTADLLAAIRALGERFPVAGAGIAMFAPPTPEDAQADLPTILRILSALTTPMRAAAQS